MSDNEPSVTLAVHQELAGMGPDFNTRKWIYSYRLTVHAADTPVVKWSVGFGDLPEGASLSKSFTDFFWGQILQDGTHGSVLLRSPELGHTIEPGTPLNIDIQVVYPGPDPAHEELASLHAQQLG
ncbi:hypothetical protein [Streptomyces chryseus]